MNRTGKSVLGLNRGFENTDKPSGQLVEGALLLRLASSEMFLRRSSCSTSSPFCSFLQDDLLSLKVVSVLHHLSIKRAIQVLRINNFEPNCLRRRPSDEVASEVEGYRACMFPCVGLSACARLRPISSWNLQGGLLVPLEPQIQPHLLPRLCFLTFLPFPPKVVLPV